jgi:5'-3' exonuclease
MIKRCLIVDAYNLFIRHYVANPTMSKNGEQIGGIVGFYNNMTKLIDRCNPSDVYIMWEGGGSVRKRNVYKDYKRQSRPVKLNRYYDDIPDTLQNRNFQIQTLIKFLDYFPVTQLYVEGSEADDVIGYLCKYRFKSRPKVIVSSDHDYYQLLDKMTVLYSPTLKDFVGEDYVINKYGIHPQNFALAKAIVGDKSDNIPGVPGVGFKTLAKEYGDMFLDPNFDANRKILFEKNFIKMGNSKKKIYRNINEKKDMIERNFQVINLDVGNLAHYQTNKIEQKLENSKKTYDNINIHKLLNENAINSIDIYNTKIIYNRLLR